MRRIFVSGLLMMVGLGCGSDGGNGGGRDPEETVDRIADELINQLEVNCECAEAPGSLSSVGPDDCEDTPDPSSWSRCVLRAVDDLDEDDQRDFLSCYLESEEAYTTCISRNECSLDTSDCGDDYKAAQRKCAKILTNRAARALDECASE